MAVALEILESGAFPRRAGKAVGSPLGPRSPSVLDALYHLQSPAFTLLLGKPRLGKSVETDASQALGSYILIAHYSGKSGSKIVRRLESPAIIPCRLKTVTVFSGFCDCFSFHYLSLHHFPE